MAFSHASCRRSTDASSPLHPSPAVDAGEDVILDGDADAAAVVVAAADVDTDADADGYGSMFFGSGDIGPLFS